MPTRILISLLGACLLLVASALAADGPTARRDLPTVIDRADIVYGGPTVWNKTVVDTIDLMGPTGSGAPHLGDFEAGWNGWTSVDETQVTENHWQVNDHNQSVPGNLAAWCGTFDYPPCDAEDPLGGFGNNWHDLLEQSVWRPGYRFCIDAALNQELFCCWF